MQSTIILNSTFWGQYDGMLTMLNINYLPNSIAVTLFTTSPCFCAMVTCPVYGIRILNNFVLHTYINKEETNWKVYIHGIEFKLLRVYNVQEGQGKYRNCLDIYTLKRCWKKQEENTLCHML